MEAGHQPSISGSYNVSQGCNDVMERNGVADREPHPKAHLCHNPLMGLGAFHHRCGEGLRNLDDLRALLDREHCYMYLYCQAQTVGFFFWVLFFFLEGGGGRGGEAEEDQKVYLFSSRILCGRCKNLKKNHPQEVSGDIEERDLSWPQKIDSVISRIKKKQNEKQSRRN